MTIVCATRFTEESSFAVTVAAELARTHHKQLWLVHVLPHGYVKSWREKLETAASTSLDFEAQKIRGPGLEVHTALVHGRLEQALERFCTEKNAALLVVGDTSEAVGPLMASTLDQLANTVETPLLVVRDSRPFHAWASGKAALRVMLALDHTASSAVARDWIVRLAAFGPIDLVAAHVWWPLEEYEHRKLPVPPAEEGHLALARVVQTETEARLVGLPKNVSHRIHLEMGVGRIGEQLLALANEEQVDLVVLGTHRRRALGRLWSVSHQVLGLAPMSVACIPGTVPVPDLSTVPTFRTALAATNFSEASSRAVTCAIGVVGYGTVHVVHVTNEPFSPEQETALLKKLTEVLPPDSERSGARVLVHVLHGDVADQLVKANDKFAVDVVCLGLNAESLSKSAVANEVMRRCGRPVLIAPVSKA